MKRVKIMLSAIAVLAIVGGALAFKSNKVFSGKLRCTIWQATPTTNCPLVTFTPDVSGAKSLCTFITAAATAPCITTTVIFNP